MVTTREKPVVFIHTINMNMIMTSKYNDSKRHQTQTQQDKKEQWIYKTIRKQLTKWQ